MFAVKPHSPGKHKPFKIAPTPDEVGHAVAMGHPNGILLNYGALIQLTGNKMAGRPYNLYPRSYACR